MTNSEGTYKLLSRWYWENWLTKEKMIYTQTELKKNISSELVTFI